MKVVIIGYYLDHSNNLEIGFNQDKGTWYSRLLTAGKAEIKENKLAGEFNFNVYHSITVLKNDKRFEIQIDDNPAPGINTILTSFTAKGIPGLFTDNC